MPHLKSLSSTASLLDVFKAYPETNKHLLAFHEVLLRGPSPFSTAEREMIAAYVSGLNGCRYCHGVHTATAEHLGIPAGLVASALTGLDQADISPRMMPVLHYARKLTERPDSIVEADVDAVYAQGWDDVALYHLVATTALFNYMNRLVEGLGIKYSEAYTKVSADRLAKTGYTMLLKMIGG